MTSAPIAEVTISLPANTRFVSLARTAAVSLAAESDFGIDDLDDLRIAIDELVTILIEAEPSDGLVVLTYALTADDSFEMTGRINTATSPTEVHPLTESILTAVTDSFAVTELECSCTKLRRAS